MAVIMSLIDFDDLQLFHQNFNLISDTQINKNTFTFIENEGFKSLKLKKSTIPESQKKKYSIEQMQKGIRIYGLYIKVINYHRYQTLVNKFQQLKTQMFNNQNILQLIFVYKGVCYYVTPLRNDMKTQKVSMKTTEFLTPLILNEKMKESNPFEMKKQYKNYFLFNVPENIQEQIAYQHIRQCDYMGEKLKNFFNILKLNHIKLQKGDLKCLAFVDKNQSENKRASKIIQLFTKQSVIQKGNVRFLFKFNNYNNSINRNKIYQKILNQNSIITHSCLKQKIELIDINQYFEIVTHQKFPSLPTKVRGLILTHILVDSIKFYLYNIINYQDILQTIYEILGFETLKIRETLNFYVSLKFILCQSNSVKAHTELVMSAGYKYCLQFFECIQQIFGISFGQFLIKIKKDSSHLIYNLKELKQQKKIGFNLLIKQSYSLRNYIYSFLIGESENQKLIINGNKIYVNVHIGKINKFYLNNLSSLQKWCNKIQNLFFNFRSISGEEQFALQPYVIKLIVQIFMQHPNYYSTLRKLQSLFNTLVLCTPELAISVYSVFALGYQKHDLNYSQQCYVKAIGIIHRTYCDPRSRGNVSNQFQTFLLSRLRNIKQIIKKETEVEFLEDMLQCYKDQKQDYPFPPFKTVNHNNQILYPLIQWIFDYIPIFNRSNIFYFKKQSLSLCNAVKSNISNESRSSNMKKDRAIWQSIQKSSETSIDIGTYNGVITFGNNKRTVNINPMLRNLTVIRISCGLSHTIFSTTDSIYGFGDNTSKQLGEFQGKGLRKMYQSDVTATSLSCGSQHSAAIIKGCLKMWGQKQGGIISGDGYYFDEIYCGGLHSMALKAGQLYSWGRGEGGQLGHPLQMLQTKKGAESTQYFLSKPKRINLKNIKKVACGDAHTIVLTQAGKVYVFGFSYQGQLGLGLTGQSQRFQIFEPQLLQFKDEIINISAGSTWSVFITKKNEVFTCGLNDFHQLGIDKAVKIIEKRKEKSLSNTRRQKRGEIEFSVPNKMQYFSENFEIESISCGENHSIARVIFNNQNLYVGWGMNKYQQLGIQNCQSTTPRIIPSLQKLDITQISCGSTFTIGLIGYKKQEKKSLRKLEAEMRQNLSGWKIIKSCF